MFILLLLAVAVTLAVSLRISTLSETRRGCDQLALALADQTGRAFQAVDLVLQDTANRVATLAAANGGDLASVLASTEVNDVLADRLANVPQLAAITVVDAQGRLVNLSRIHPAPPVDVSGRDYFRALADSSRPELFVSAPVQRRFDGNWTVLLARRLGAAGGFGGLVAGAITLDAIEGFYSAVTTKPGSSVTLLRDDGLILARFPRDAAVIGRHEALVTPKSLVARHEAGPYHLVVEVAVDEHAALFAWRRQVVAIAMLTALACAGIALMLRTIAQQLRSAQRASRSLAARNAELEEARLRLEQQASRLTDTAAAMRNSESLLAERSATLHTTLENIDQGILMVDAAGTVVAYNQRLLEMLGMPDALLARRPAFSELLKFQWETGEFERTGQTLRDFAHAGGLLDRPQIYERERPNGRTLEVRSLPLPGGGLVRTYTDITERKNAEARIQRIATIDELTGLANRVWLEAELERQKGSLAPGQELALLYLDLDRFRLINDARSHEVGDRVLVEVGRRLQSGLGGDDVVARIGGDEFAVLHRLECGEDDMALAGKLLAAIAEPFVIGGLRLSVTASAGLTRADAELNAQTVMRDADIALYRAKDAGGNKSRHYEPAMAAAQQERFQVEQALREALGRDAFQVEYQPVVSLESSAVVGYEALLRWTDRTRGEVAPRVFIPVAEITGLIVPLGRWVLERACLEAASWSNECGIAVNLSPVQFQAGDLVEIVQDCLTRSGLRPGRLELEVTEGVLLEDSGAVLETILALRRAGVCITLDDFGTGHAGLSYLRRFPFDKIKIDRSFIRDLGSDRGSDAIVEAILLLGRRLDLRVVAEGVENDAQLERLRELRCPLIQGYLSGRPMSAEIARAL